MRPLTLGPVTSLSGEVRLPGSKSISNRALLLASLADGRTRLDNLLEGDDTRFMRDALETLGIRTFDDGGSLTVEASTARWSPTAAVPTCTSAWPAPHCARWPRP